MRIKRTDERKRTRPGAVSAEEHQGHAALAAIVRQIMSDYRARLAAEDLAREGVSYAACEEPAQEEDEELAAL